MRHRSLAPPDPPLDDGVVRLRELRPADAPAYARAFREDPDLGRLSGEDPDPDEAEAAKRITEVNPRRIAAGEAVELAVAESDHDAFIGAALLNRVSWRHGRAEIGFWLTRDARGQGMGRRMLDLLVDWAFGPLALARVHLETYPENEATRALARRAGFVEEGLLREHALERGERVSLVVCGLLARERALKQTSGQSPLAG